MTPDVSAELAAIARHFPELEGAEHRVMNRGWDCLAIGITGLVFKFPRNAGAAEALRREVRLLGLVRRGARMAVPDMRMVEDDLPFSWHPILPGEPLLTEYQGLTEAQRERLSRDVAGFVADVHRIPVGEAVAAGAVPVEVWQAPAEIAGRLGGLMSVAEAAAAREVLATAAVLPPDPEGEVFGQFDGHGWNMAFDHAVGRLNGIYDFGDAGIGERHRDFIYMGFISYDLTRRVLPAYQAETGIMPDARRISVQTGWHRLWELVEAEATHRPMHLAHFRAWLAAGRM